MTRVIQSAEAAASSTIAAARYDFRYNNCEHFVTACKGLLEGYGWSCQIESKGSHCYGNQPFPTQDSGRQDEDTITRDFTGNPNDESDDDETDDEPADYDAKVYGSCDLLTSP